MTQRNVKVDLVETGGWYAFGAGIAAVLVVVFALSLGLPGALAGGITALGLLVAAGCFALSYLVLVVRRSPKSIVNAPSSVAPGVIDLRSDEACAEEERATRPLEPDDEADAATLVTLAPSARRAMLADTSGDDASMRIRLCGEKLHARGGDELMRVVAHRAICRLRERGETIRPRDFEHWWNGIGGWEY